MAEAVGGDIELLRGAPDQTAKATHCGRAVTKAWRYNGAFSTARHKRGFGGLVRGAAEGLNVASDRLRHAFAA